MKKIIERATDLTIDPRSLSTFPKPQKVMMADPRYFDYVLYKSAPAHRKNAKQPTIDKNLARTQWENLKKIYEDLDYRVFVCDGEPNAPDLVYCANQAFPYVTRNHEKRAILSNMYHDERHPEVGLVHSFLLKQKYRNHRIASRTDGYFFESMGDLLWLGNHRFLLGGYGQRTAQKTYNIITNFLEAPIAVFELLNPVFYHLDTCLSILNATTALFCREAFTDQGYELLRSIFPTLIQAPLAEADLPFFACNAHCPDEKHVIIPKGCTETNQKLKDHGFEIIEADVSEFVKSYGAVFCMKLMFF